jgi:multidrug efflux system membrane fusion protein
MDTRTPASLQFPGAGTLREKVTQASPRTRMILGIVGVAVLLALAWQIFGAGPAKPKKPPAPVHVGTAVIGNMPVVEHTIGTVLAESTVNVNAQVSGQLLAADFKEGQVVHEGDLLFQIDPRPFQAALEQAQAALARDAANAASAKNDETRFVALYKQNAASQQQRDQAVATAKADAALVQSDQAAIDIAKLNLGYTQIRSPINGKTGPILMQPGNLIAATSSNQTATPLVTITQIQPVKVSFFLPQSELPQIQNQMANGGLMAVIPMDGAKGGIESAPVNFVGNAVSAQTGTIELRATYLNDDLRLVPGQMVNVGVTMNSLHNVLVVPRDAVNAGPDGSYVYVVDKQSKAAQIPVTVLHDDGTNMAIQGNVKPGDKVITEGQLRVVPGADLVISQAPRASFAQPLPPGAQ